MIIEINKEKKGASCWSLLCKEEEQVHLDAS
jgi:hypothetical protein